VLTPKPIAEIGSTINPTQLNLLRPHFFNAYFNLVCHRAIIILLFQYRYISAVTEFLILAKIDHFVFL